ncbi:MAG: hypothetical protein GF317_03735 [Candidatus Lokiarchaeota archaeon]|nr:hypothetical protein [Candidatus Lokiarchaeota archaeon]MBD3198999.1 hypothetical protein [Candidatus Lokiarchaeota archaeon]
MQPSLVIRKINKFERKMISDSISYFNEDQNNILDKLNKKIYVLIRKGESKMVYPKLFYLSKEMIKTLNIIEIKHDIVSIGTYLGFFKKGRFILSLEGCELLIDLNFISEKFKYYVNERAEKSILYGNAIYKSMLRTPSNILNNRLVYGDLIFLFNIDNCLISINLLIQDSNIIPGLNDNAIIANNLIDKGYYLRMEQ